MGAIAEILSCDPSMATWLVDRLEDRKLVERLDKSGAKPPLPLDTKCSEGPAVSRKRMHIAWTHVAAEYPDEMPAGTSRMQEADVEIVEGQPPKLVNQRLIVESRELPFPCTMVPPTPTAHTSLAPLPHRR